MCDMQKKVLLIIPCYNEEKRLDFRKFEGYNYHFLFVNDGSIDNTCEFIKTNLKENMYALNLEKNSGKAEAVRQGMLHAKTLPIYDDLDWIGFWDADLSTPLDEVQYFLAYSQLFSCNIDGIFGSRIYKLGSEIRRSFKRHYLGRLFASLVGIVLKIDSYDSQCGAKLFKKDIIDQTFNHPFISKWIFDVEIILRLKNKNILECPLRGWMDVKGSKVRILKESTRILKDIANIKKKYISSDNK
ncbi:MAG: glycosyltransferase [Bacillota bacterium]